MHNRLLHICIVTSGFPALTETFITNKVLALKKRGHRVTVIKNNNNLSLNHSHLSLVKEAGIEILMMNELSSLKHFLASVATHPRLFISSLSSCVKKFKTAYKSKLQVKLLNTHRYDIIHFEFSGLAVAYMHSLAGTKAKTVVSCRGTAEKVKPLTDTKRAANLQRIFSAVNAIHCVSEDMAKTVQELGADKEKIFVNTPAIDTDLFKRSNKYVQQKAVITILTIGRFTFQKGYLMGLLAMKELKEKGIEYKWLIVGDGPLHEEITYHIHALGLAGSVELLGSKTRDEILALYNMVDIFLLPSVYEGIANVCLEAMAMELPVVSTRSGGMEEVIVDKQNGVLCDIYNPSDIAQKLQTVSANSVWRQQLGTNARETVVNNFTLNKQVDIFEQQYWRLVNN
jgi:colanic acid/amylovoran biosynthesis glycosyltransferase